MEGGQAQNREAAGRKDESHAHTHTPFMGKLLKEVLHHRMFA